ncbi:phasin family protein [Dyella sp. 2HG41-7]|uniref:phasin family protein n=1 Tax=Dyella sp. 2HG41-7 TaxID=2883239 RepID=UPI001F1D7A0D|nr:phasin family protein [Dyella sp. 2HG41-7]
MTQQLNTQVFAYAKQLADNAFKAHVLAIKGLEQVAELQLAALEKQTQATADFIVQAAEVRDIDALRGLWEKGTSLSREQAESAVSVTKEVVAVAQKTAESLNALLQEQQKATSEAVAAPVAAIKKAAAAK